MQDEPETEALRQLILVFVNTQDMAGKRRMLETEPGLRDEAAARLLDQLADAQPEPLTRAYVAAHAALLRSAAAHGIDVAWEVFEADPAVQARGVEVTLAERLVAVLRLPTWNDARAALQDQPDLLSEPALDLLAHLAEALEDPGARASVEEHLALFRRAAEIGIDQAFEETGLGGGGSLTAGVSGELRDLLEALAPLQGDPTRAPDLVELCDRALTRVERPAQDPLRASLQNRANALQLLGELAGDPAMLRAAVAGFDAALEVFTRETVPGDWATTQQNRASALQSIGELAGDPSTLRAAMAGYDAALEVRG